MGIGQISVAAATAIVGYDLFGDEWFQAMAAERALTLIGVAGSAAALDTLVVLYVDDVLVGEFYNSAAGAVLLDAHGLELDDIYVPAFAKIRCVVEDAPATNPINVTLQWEEL